MKLTINIFCFWHFAIKFSIKVICPRVVAGRDYFFFFPFGSWSCLEDLRDRSRSLMDSVATGADIMGLNVEKTTDVVEGLQVGITGGLHDGVRVDVLGEAFEVTDTELW